MSAEKSSQLVSLILGCTGVLCVQLDCTHWNRAESLSCAPFEAGGHKMRPGLIC